MSHKPARPVRREASAPQSEEAIVSEPRAGTMNRGTSPRNIWPGSRLGEGPLLVRKRVSGAKDREMVP